jgi:hypothetical protein
VTIKVLAFSGHAALYRLRSVGSMSMFPAIAAVCCALALAGCANSGKSNGDPGAKPLAAGQTCQSIKADLDRMVAGGVQSAVEAQSAGRKQSPNQKADADRYNSLLAQYLGARCHAV